MRILSLVVILRHKEPVLTTISPYSFMIIHTVHQTMARPYRQDDRRRRVWRAQEVPHVPFNIAVRYAVKSVPEARREEEGAGYEGV